MQEIKKETDAEKIERRRVGKRDWQRAKTLRIKTENEQEIIEIGRLKIEKEQKMEQERIEIGNQIIAKTEEEIMRSFWIETCKLQKLHQDNNLEAFPNWMFNLQKLVLELLQKKGKEKIEQEKAEIEKLEQKKIVLEKKIAKKRKRYNL